MAAWERGCLILLNTLSSCLCLRQDGEEARKGIKMYRLKKCEEGRAQGVEHVESRSKMLDSESNVARLRSQVGSWILEVLLTREDLIPGVKPLLEAY